MANFPLTDTLLKPLSFEIKTDEHFWLDYREKKTFFNEYYSGRILRLTYLDIWHSLLKAAR